MGILCKLFEEQYDKLDNGEGLNILMRAHLMFCPRCSHYVAQGEKLHAALANSQEYNEEFSTELANRITGRVMDAVSLMPLPRKRISVRSWIISGLLIVLSLVLLPFSTNFAIMRATFSDNYTFPLMLILGGAFIVHITVFAANYTHETEIFLKKFFRLP